MSCRSSGPSGGKRKTADTITETERRQKIRPLTLEHLGRFLAAAFDLLPLRDATLLLTLADTGLRPGEGLGLQWGDVDIANRTLNIERSISGGKEKGTKTNESRPVDLTSRLAEALVRWQATLETDALMEDRDVSPWVFPSSTGTWLDLSRVSKQFRALVRAAELPRHHSLYDLWHKFASHLLADSAPITYVAAQLGHKKPTTTLAYYVRRPHPRTGPAP